MQFLLCFAFSQIGFEFKAPIILDIKPFAFERILALNSGFLICNENSGVIHRFDLDGNFQGNLGDGHERAPQLPYRVSWIPDQRQLYVYDAAAKEISVWTADGDYLRTIATDFDVFFQIGRLLPARDGFITPISLTEDSYLLGRFDAGFKMKSYAYEVIYSELSSMSPELYKTFALRVAADGQPLYLAAQTLAAKIHIFDENLNFIRSFILNSGGWKPANLRRLERISRNPKELDKYRERFSEVVAMEALSGDRYVVGIRNLTEPWTYAYQCYDAGLDLPVGEALETAYRLVGSNGDTLYFLNAKSTRTTLIPCAVE